MYLADEQNPNRVFVFASAAGAETNPAWYHNLRAHPDQVQVEIGAENVPARAEILPEPQRGVVYAVQAGRYPGFAEYQAKTGRPIPVLSLHLHRHARPAPGSDSD